MIDIEFMLNVPLTEYQIKNSKEKPMGLSIFIKSQSDNTVHLRTDNVSFHIVDASGLSFVKNSGKWNGKWSEIKWTKGEIYGKHPLISMAELYGDSMTFFPDGKLHFLVEIYYSSLAVKVEAAVKQNVECDECCPPAEKKAKLLLVDDLFESLLTGNTIILKMAKDGTELKAHIDKLCNSSKKFRTELSFLPRNNMLEILEILGFSGATVTEYLRFIYCGKVQNIEQHAIELFKFAADYDVKDLKELAQASIKNGVNVETALAIAQQTAALELAEVFDECCRVIHQ